MSQDEKSGPGVSSLAREVMLPIWSKADSVLGGTRTMRSAGEQHLPKHQGETSDRYSERLGTAVLWNQSELTLNNWVGRPFSDPVLLGDDVPEGISALKTNIDLQGTDLHVFAQHWFKVGLSKSFCHVMIDFPRKSTDHTTLADDKASGNRPYWNLVEPERVIGARAITIDGREVLSHLRLYEVTTEVTNGYNERLVERIKEYNLVEGRVEVTVWRRLDEEEFEDADSWKREDSFTMDIAVIPLVTFYSDRQGFLLGKPPLLDLYDMNIQHWQSDSDQNAILTIARFPILAMSGTDQVEDPDGGGGAITGGGPNGETIIGPFSILTTPENGGRIYYVEHAGRAIGAGKESLAELRDRMSSYGAAFLKKAPGRQTATARALDSAESISPLQAMTLQFKSALEEALRFTAMWLNEDSGGTVTLLTDFGPEEVSREDFEALKDAETRGRISRKVFLEEYKRRGVLNDKYDFDEDSKQLLDEKKKFKELEPEEPEEPKIEPRPGEEKKDRLPVGGDLKTGGD